MAHLLTNYWQTLSAPVERARERWRLRVYARGMRGCGCGCETTTRAPSATRAHRSDERASGSERLEQIAVYARAGYFNMGYTVDVFQMPAELPPH